MGACTDWLTEETMRTVFRLARVTLGAVGGWRSSARSSPPPGARRSRPPRSPVRLLRVGVRPRYPATRLSCRRRPTTCCRCSTHDCSPTGFWRPQRAPPAVVRTATGWLRHVSFDAGWRVYHRHGAAQLVAVCHDAPTSRARSSGRRDGEGWRAVPAFAAGEALGTLEGAGRERRHPVAQLVRHRLVIGQAVLLEQRELVLAQALLRQGGQRGRAPRPRPAPGRRAPPG